MYRRLAALASRAALVTFLLGAKTLEQRPIRDLDPLLPAEFFRWTAVVRRNLCGVRPFLAQLLGSSTELITGDKIRITQPYILKRLSPWSSKPGYVQ